MKQETCGKPVEGLPKQEKAEKQKGRRKPTRGALQKSPTLGEILDAHSIKDLIKPTKPGP